jgi:hypothetical protein
MFSPEKNAQKVLPTHLVDYLADDLAASLMKQLEAFCALAETEGVRIRPYTERCIQEFRNFPTEVQTLIYKNFNFYFEAVQSIQASGIALRDTPRSLWHLFKMRGLRPTSDLFTVITDRSIVELYLPNHIQWYRSFNYYEYTSYSLGDLICYKWSDLFAHNETLMNYIMEAGEKIFSGAIKSSLLPPFEPVVSQEQFSEKRYVAQVHMQMLSPIINELGHNEACAAISSIELLENDNSLDIEKPQGPPFKYSDGPLLVV